LSKVHNKASALRRVAARQFSGHPGMGQDGAARQQPGQGVRLDALKTGRAFDPVPGNLGPALGRQPKPVVAGSDTRLSGFISDYGSKASVHLRRQVVLQGVSYQVGDTATLDLGSVKQSAAKLL